MANSWINCFEMKADNKLAIFIISLSENENKLKQKQQDQKTNKKKHNFLRQE